MSNYPILGVDLETRPRYDLVEKYAKAFPPYKIPLPFDPNSVKYGNMKDEAKRAEKLAQAQYEYTVMIGEDEAQYQKTKGLYYQKLHDNAALDPHTSEILVIGLIDECFNITYLEGKEEDILNVFWKDHWLKMLPDVRLVFWSGSGNGSNMFDVDRIVTRSRIRGIRVPANFRKGRFYNDRVVDLAKEYLLFKSDQYCSLTIAAEVMELYTAEDNKDENTRIYAKKDEHLVTGASFWKWYDGTGTGPTGTETIPLDSKNQKKLAMEYLANDLLHLPRLAARIL